MSPVLASRHWSVSELILRFYRSPLKHFTVQLLPYESGCSLRSSGRALLVVPESRLKTKGDRAFAVKALQLWNSLPTDLRLAQSVTSFKSLLETSLFKKTCLNSSTSLYCQHAFSVLLLVFIFIVGLLHFISALF